MHWVVSKFRWFIVLISKSYHRGSHCRPNIFCLTLNEGEYRCQMHLNFTVAIGTNVMQSSVFVGKKKLYLEVKNKVKVKVTIKMEELNTLQCSQSF